MNPIERNIMTRFMKQNATEIALIVIGYIAFTLMQILGRIALRLGRVVFSR
jgi:hypothetical protein